MNKIPSFKEIENYRFIYSDNEFFTQYYNEDLINHPDANCMWLKSSPFLEEFRLIENIQYAFKDMMDHSFIKFIWPEDIGIRTEVFDYLSQEQYKLGRQNLYILEKNKQSVLSINSQLEIKTKNNLEDFIHINLEEDLSSGLNNREQLYRYQDTLSHIDFVVGYLEGQPVASLTLIHSDTYIEIDNVLTKKEYRKKRFASTLIDCVLNHLNNKNKPILIKVDAEDTPKIFYENVGFKLVSSQINVEKHEWKPFLYK